MFAHPKKAIFLGAGASSAEGAPMQGELFREYFINNPDDYTHSEIREQLSDFFKLMFGVDVNSQNLKDVTFPTFEEALGIAELAVSRKESLRNFDLETNAGSNNLRSVRQNLIFLMAEIINKKLKEKSIYHTQLVTNLHKKELLHEICFVSSNYDILIDNVLTEMYPQYHLDYSTDFANFSLEKKWHEPDKEKSIQLHKLHGSLNWLFCPTCNNLTLTPKEKGVIKLLTRYKDSMCGFCGSVYLPLIVPPTYYKDLTNVFLSNIWNKCEETLRDVDHVIFCGYSFPDADLNVKYLFKRIQTNRTTPLKFTVINNHAMKTQQAAEAEKLRYQRFLGEKNVNYSKMSFEEFSSDPESMI